MVIRELITRLGFDVDDKALKQFDRGLQNVKTGMLGVISTAGAATVALFALVKTAANQADELNRSALAAGIGVESLQRLGFAAMQSGSSMEELSTGLRFLNKNIYSALKDGTGEQTKAFAKLGISMSDLKNNSPEVLLSQISDGFSKLSTQGEKSAVSLEIFGKQGSGLLEFLNLGSAGIARLTARADAFGVTTEGQIQSLKAFNDALGAVLWIFGQLRNTVAASLAPEFTKMLHLFEDFLIVNADIIKENLIGFFKALGSYLKIMSKIALSIAGIFVYLGSKMGGVEKITKILLLGITALSSTFIVAGLISMAVALKAIAVAAILAAAPFALLAAKIVLVVGTILLVLDDLYNYFQGNDSVTGIIVEKFGWAFNWVKNKANEFLNYLAAKFSDFGTSIAQYLLGTFKPIMDFLNNIAEITSKIPTSVMSNLGGLFGSNTATGITPQNTPLAGSAQSTSNVSVNAPITVNVPRGTDPSQVGDRVESGVGLGLQDILDRANRTSAPSLGY